MNREGQAIENKASDLEPRQQCVIRREPTEAMFPRVAARRAICTHWQDPSSTDDLAGLEALLDNCVIVLEGRLTLSLKLAVSHE